MEEWKDIYYFDCTKDEWIDYRGNYQVSNLGRVKSLNYKHTGQERILKARRDGRGYRIVQLYKKGKGKNFKIHRLVAQAFLPNPNKLPCVDHINTKRDDNQVENLRWCSQKDNRNNPLSKKNYSKKVICTTTEKIYDSLSEASMATGIAISSISQCCNGRYKFVKDPITGEELIFMFLEDYESLK